MRNVRIFEMVSSFNRSLSAHFSRRSLSFGSPRVPSSHRKTCFSQSFNTLFVIVVLISLFFAVGGGYLYVLPNLNHAMYHGYPSSNFVGSATQCDVFNGSWVPDNSYPLYDASECPFVERGFNCLANGRSDKDYLKWRWQPQHCDIPRFNVSEVLERLRGKRVVFVGDSMSRTQWESLICLLMTGVEDKKSVYEINGNKITKQIRFLGVRFHSFDFSIEFFRSVFLVQQSGLLRNGPKRVKSTLKLDKLDNINKRWADADILIFNTGQWWTPGKLFNVGCYFQVGRVLKLGMNITAAFRTALGTWASWIEENVDTSRTQVFFRTFEPSHWSDWALKICNVTQHPMLETEENGHSGFSDIIHEVVTKMNVSVNVLHVTSMSAFRSDAHVGTCSDTPSVADCSHWCLPGVPDTWNELLLFYILSRR